MVKGKWRWPLLFLSLLPLIIAYADEATLPEPLLNLDFNQVPTRALLLNLARFSHKNILLSPNIQGEMSLHVDHLPWSDVLQLIIQSQNLNRQQMGQVIYISPLAEAQNLQQATLLASAQSPLQQLFIPLSYAKATDILALIKSPDSHFLSSRASITADPRTNSLWLEDIKENLAQLQQFIQKMDVAAPQIAINARIVTVDLFHERDLGFQFGINSLHHLSGTLKGANAAQSDTSSSVPIDARLNFNLPAMPADQAASIGVAMLPIADGYALDLALSALEAEGFGKIIASPHLLTNNLQTASIETGEDIPYQEKTSSGATNVTIG